MGVQRLATRRRLVSWLVLGVALLAAAGAVAIPLLKRFIAQQRSQSAQLAQILERLGERAEKSNTRLGALEAQTRDIAGFLEGTRRHLAAIEKNNEFQSSRLGGL